MIFNFKNMGDMAEVLYELEEKHTDTREEEWNNGFHRTRNGDIIRISDMTDSHIISCIQYFKTRFNVSYFEWELERRGKKSKKKDAKVASFKNKC